MNGIDDTCNGGVINTDVFDPESLLITNSTSPLSYSVMILNRPIAHPPNFLLPFWNKAAVRVTVDGGTNRWYSYLDSEKGQSENVANIDIVSGDFDSIDGNTLRRAGTENVKVNSVIYTPDQNETDFTKAIKELSTHCCQNQIKLDALFVVCQSSGRLDQIMGNLNTMYKYMKEKWLQDVPLYLLSDDSLSWLLRPGETTINIPNYLSKNKNSWCALIPLGIKCEDVTTSGLKWNLKNGLLEFGRLVSTSNTFDGSRVVTVDTKTCLLWSMNIVPMFSKLYGIEDKENS